MIFDNNINDHPIRNRKIFSVCDDMIADIYTNKKFQAIIKHLLFRYRKLNVSLVFITQSYFCTHYPVMKICNKRELSHIAFNHSAGILIIKIL